MTHIAAIVLILGLCLPQTLIDRRNKCKRQDQYCADEQCHYAYSGLSIWKMQRPSRDYY